MCSGFFFSFLPYLFLLNLLVFHWVASWLTYRLWPTVFKNTGVSQLYSKSQRGNSFNFAAILSLSQVLNFGLASWRQSQTIHKQTRVAVSHEILVIHAEMQIPYNFRMSGNIHLLLISLNHLRMLKSVLAHQRHIIRAAEDVGLDCNDEIPGSHGTKLFAMSCQTSSKGSGNCNRLECGAPQKPGTLLVKVKPMLILCPALWNNFLRKSLRYTDFSHWNVCLLTYHLCEPEDSRSC